MPGDNQRVRSILTEVFSREREDVAFAMAPIAPGSHLVIDRIAHCNLLDPHFSAGRTNHSGVYSLGDGIHTNGAES